MQYTERERKKMRERENEREREFCIEFKHKGRFDVFGK